MNISSAESSIRSIKNTIYSIENKINSLKREADNVTFKNILCSKFNMKPDNNIKNYMNMPLFDGVINSFDKSLKMPIEVISFLNNHSKDVHEIANDKINNFSKKIIDGISDVTNFERINSIVEEIANHNNLDPDLAKAVIKVESNYNPNAKSHAGAMGLMQLMPDTAKSLGVHDPYDVNENIGGGIKLLKSLLESFNGDIKLALAAYNAGSSRVREHDGIPPIPETQDYVKKVLEIYDPNIL